MSAAVNSHGEVNWHNKEIGKGVQTLILFHIIPGYIVYSYMPLNYVKPLCYNQKMSTKDNL